MIKPTILIVDDEDQFRESLSEGLEEDFHVLTASSAKEGLAKIKKNPLSLILLDLRMPRVTGVELLETLRSQNRCPRKKSVSSNYLKLLIKEPK